MPALRILGPLELGDDARAGSAALGGQKPRRLLAALALYANEVVAADRLIDAVWADQPPRSARANLLTYLSSLRRHLSACGCARGGLSIEARPPGYRLLARPDSLDWYLFTTSAGTARQAHTEDPDRARRLLREALGLWRGPVLADVADGLVTLRPRIAALEEARLAAQVLLIDAELRAGRHAEVLGELAELTLAHPLHEKLCGQHMTALYRSGRQSEALAAYRLMCGRLRGELGIDPGAELSGLFEQILRADAGLGAWRDPGGPARLAGPGAPLTGEVPGLVPRQLPGRVRAFTGRRRELALLDALLASEGETMPVGALTGPPGVGKTALALHWAHRVQGRFTGGTLFADLRGFSPENAPRAPAEVLDGFLRALGVPEIPSGETDRAALLRTALDGKRVLLVLDNAANSQQVRPLLPASPGCLVLVTSRSSLTGLAVRDGAERLPVEPLQEPDAVALLRRIILPGRVDAEPAAADELSRLCGGLPLALRIAGERTAARPALPLTAMAAQLSAERDRLDVLTGGDDDSAAVRPVFAWSYQALPGDVARLFRLLGLFPGADFSEAAAAALAGMVTARAHGLLEALAQVHLVSRKPGGRYFLHDLLRLYAAELAGPDEPGTGQAMARLLAWYLHSADAADRLLLPHRSRTPLPPAPPGTVPAVFSGPEQALAWCTAEEANMVAVTRLAAGTGDHTTAWMLPDALYPYLNMRSRFDSWVACYQTGLASARTAGDPHAEAQMLTGLGAAYCDMGDYERAMAPTRRALEIRRGTGDKVGAALCLGHIAEIFLVHGRFGDAIAPVTEALDVFRASGEEFFTGIALSGLGMAYRGMRRGGDAVGCLEQAVAVFTGLGERFNEAYSAHELGRTYHDLGRFGQARRWYERALAIHRSTGAAAAQAQTLMYLGDLYAAQGDAARAATVWRESVRIYDRIGDRRAGVVRARLSQGPAAHGA